MKSSSSFLPHSQVRLNCGVYFGNMRVSAGLAYIVERSEDTIYDGLELTPIA